MQEILLNIKENFINKKTASFLLISIIFGIIVYSVLISNSLTNQYDGLWNGTYYLSSKPEVGAGRWMFFICDRLIFGYKGDPFISCFSITIFSLGNLLLVNLLNIDNKIEKYFISFSILATTTVCCMLSYKHQSYIFSLSYFFAILSAYCLIKIENKYLSFAISIVSLVLSLGSYQSQIGCFCLSIFLYLIVNNREIKELKNIITIIIKALVTVIVSCILYKIISDIMINLLNVSFSYKGFDSLSVIDMIKVLPQSIINTYKYFFDYYFGNYNVNVYGSFLYIIIFIFVAFISIFTLIKTKNILEFLWLLLIPICCNFSVLLVDTGVLLQQTLAITIVMPILIVISYEKMLSIKQYKMLISAATIVLSTVLFLGNVISVGIDIESIRQGKNSTEFIISSVCEDLIDKNMINSDAKYYFVGTPCNNELFNVNDLWNQSNDYARYGDFWKNAFCLPISYQGVVNNIGVNLKCNFPSNQEYNEFIEGDYCKDMPCYPNEGYIKEENGCIFIKISNDYIVESE